MEYLSNLETLVGLHNIILPLTEKAYQSDQSYNSPLGIETHSDICKLARSLNLTIDWAIFSEELKPQFRCLLIAWGQYGLTHKQRRFLATCLVKILETEVERNNQREIALSVGCF